MALEDPTRIAIVICAALRPDDGGKVATTDDAIAEFVDLKRTPAWASKTSKDARGDNVVALTIYGIVGAIAACSLPVTTAMLCELPHFR